MSAASQAPSLIPAKVDRYCIDPCLYGRLRNEFCHVEVDPNKCFLDDIVGCGLIIRIAEHEAVQWLAVPLDQLVKGGIIARLERFDERQIRVYHRSRSFFERTPRQFH